MARKAPTIETLRALFAKSGNQCAFPNCTNQLINDKNQLIGQLCHIEAANIGGERYNPDQIDEERREYDNLILLCYEHHIETNDEKEFTVEKLKEIKKNHENKFINNPYKVNDIVIKRIQQNIPEFLIRLLNGKDVLNIVGGAHVFSFDYDELINEEEVDIVGSFLQLLQDFGDLWDDFESYERTKCTFTITQEIKDLEKAGFWVFGQKEDQILEGGINIKPSKWVMAIIHIKRKTNDEIIKVSIKDII